MVTTEKVRMSVEGSGLRVRNMVTMAMAIVIASSLAILVFSVDLSNRV